MLHIYNCHSPTEFWSEHFRFHCILRGSISLLVDPLYNSSRGALSDSTTLPVTTSQPKTTDDKTQKSRIVEVGLLSAGDYFGQIACLQKDKRAGFSALASDYTELLTIEDRVFQDILAGNFEAKLFSMATFLSHQYFFSLWSTAQLASLCLNLSERKMAMDECIYCQGMETKEVYFIKSGSVRILLNSSTHVPELVLQMINPPTDYVAKLLENDQRREIQLHRQQEKGKPKRQQSTESRINSASAQATKCVRGQNQALCCRLHEPWSSFPLCVFLRGEVLSGVEVLCGLQEHLFTAVCCSEVELYVMNIEQFNHLFPKHSCSTAAAEMLLYYIEQVTEWKRRHPQMELFSPLLTLLHQQLTQCQKCCCRKSRRGVSPRSPDTRAESVMANIMKKEYIRSSSKDSYV